MAYFLRLAVIVGCLAATAYCEAETDKKVVVLENTPSEGTDVFVSKEAVDLVTAAYGAGRRRTQTTDAGTTGGNENGESDYVQSSTFDKPQKEYADGVAKTDLSRQDIYQTSGGGGGTYVRPDVSPRPYLKPDYVSPQEPIQQNRYQPDGEFRGTGGYVQQTAYREGKKTYDVPQRPTYDGGYAGPPVATGQGVAYDRPPQRGYSGQAVYDQRPVYDGRPGPSGGRPSFDKPQKPSFTGHDVQRPIYDRPSGDGYRPPQPRPVPRPDTYGPGRDERPYVRPAVDDVPYRPQPTPTVRPVDVGGGRDTYPQPGPYRPSGGGRPPVPPPRPEYDDGHHHNDDGKWLEVYGRPGQDFPVHSQVPNTGFRCSDQQYPGFYADVDAQCQVFHICQEGGKIDSFLCPNATLFNQKYFVCDWWQNVDCAASRNFYELNSELYRESQTTGGPTFPDAYMPPTTKPPVVPSRPEQVAYDRPPQRFPAGDGGSSYQKPQRPVYDGGYDRPQTRPEGRPSYEKPQQGGYDRPPQRKPGGYDGKPIYDQRPTYDGGYDRPQTRPDVRPSYEKPQQGGYERPVYDQRPTYDRGYDRPQSRPDGRPVYDGGYDRPSGGRPSFEKPQKPTFTVHDVQRPIYEVQPAVPQRPAVGRPSFDSAYGGGDGKSGEYPQKPTFSGPTIGRPAFENGLSGGGYVDKPGPSDVQRPDYQSGGGGYTREEGYKTGLPVSTRFRPADPVIEQKHVDFTEAPVPHDDGHKSQVKFSRQRGGGYGR